MCSEIPHQLYMNKLRNLEEMYKFHDFHSPPLDEADFDSKPMILLVGQYSTGKTTFIKGVLSFMILSQSRPYFELTRLTSG